MGRSVNLLEDKTVIQRDLNRFKKWTDKNIKEFSKGKHEAFGLE